mmetsp:Transcript_36867/g.35592  ORF Transcript_36867/g.35592 Transcript_36867/m.35592 type:complete len:96 (+) Transcript_36867:937-1224(+)
MINKSLNILNAELSKEIMQILVTMNNIEWKSKEEKSKLGLTLLKIHQNIIDSRALTIDKADTSHFNELLTSLSQFNKEKQEQLKLTSVQVIHKYL